MNTTIKRRFLSFVRPIGNIGAAFVMAGAFTGIAPALAHADTDISILPNGTVISSNTVTLPSDLQSIAHGKRVVYVTTDANNHKVLSSGLVMTPNTRPLFNNIVTWSHALSGVADQCAPSVDQTDYFYPEAVAAVAGYLQKGWTVSATDYAGLGVNGQYQTFVGNTEARSVIDSVRAARNLDPRLTRNWVAAGHSGGGSSPIFASEIAPSYGSGLHLKGVVAMAPASNLDSILPFIAGTPGNGYIPLTLYGLAQVDPSVHPGEILAAPAKALLPVLHSGCVFDILGAYADLTADQMLVGGEIPSDVLAKIAQYDNPGQVHSSAPLLLLQGLDDAEVPPFLTELLQSEECAQGSTSQLDELAGVGHDDLPIVTTTTQTDYIQARFSNQAAPSNC